MTMSLARKSPVRIIIVDDSPAVRDLLAALMHNAGDILVVGMGSNGEDAVRLVKRLHPDLITLDMQMPRMDGLEATRQIMRECPTPILILSAVMKQPDSDLTFQALQAGALAVLAKPGLEDEQACAEIIQTIRTMSGVPVIHHWGRKVSGVREPDVAGKKDEDVTQAAQEALSTRQFDIVGIAASTGGPNAVASILELLPPDFPLPILIVQHISAGFAPGLVQWMSTRTRLRVELAAHGDLLQPGIVLMSPDDYHLQVNERGIVELSKAEPYKTLRPSANFLFDSLARVFGPHALGIMLTGMGDDGSNGIEALHNSGGFTIAQDEASSVVYGMPREAVARNAVDRVMPLSKIGPFLNQVVRTDRTAAKAKDPR